ncbi:MAG: ABC transporter substrate-binding protein [Anaerolineae bacterium]|nr:ABC transporter substrate-binding protein [Anaerolineae bacterium]
MKLATRILLIAAVLLLALPAAATYAQSDATTVTTAFAENQPNTLDPAAAALGDEFLVLRNVAEGLVTYDPKTLKPIPALAESWTVSDDGLVYTFKLRSGVTFQDGSTLDAKDVKYSLDRLARRETGTSYTAGLVLSAVVGWADVRPPAPPAVGEGTPTPEPPKAADSLSGVAIVDDMTVSITLKAPQSAFLNRLTLPGAFIIPEGAGEAEGFAQKPIGSGPYKVAEFTPQQQVVLEANDSYWGGAPEVKKVVIRVIPEQSVQVVEFEAGNLDIVVVPESDLPRIRGDEKLKTELVEIPTLSLFNLRVNLNDPQLKDARVRRALAMAIDRQTIIDTVLQGQGVPANGLYPPGLSAYDPSFAPLAYNPEGAKALLAEAGYPNGITIELRTGQIETERRVLAAIQQTAVAAGITINVNATEKSLYDADRTKCTMQAGTVAWGLDYPDPENVAQLVIAGSSTTRINCGYGTYEKAKDVEKLYAEAVASPLGDARDALFRQLQEIAVGEQATLIPIYHGLSTSLVNARLGGTPIDNNGTRQFALIKLNK